MQATLLLKNLHAIHRINPIIHNITNLVVMQLTANALLAIGASPIMAHAVEEIPEIIKNSHALVINLGTLDSSWLKSMQKALQIANQYNIPIVLDPVGAGATKFRNNSALDLLNTGQVAVIRGNAAEIIVLAGTKITSHGIDSLYTAEAAINAMNKLSEKYQTVVAVSGKNDLILQNNSRLKINNGHPMLTKITGMGCTASAIIAAFCAVTKDYFSAAAHGMFTMGLAGEIAANNSSGPGTMQTHFIDALHNLLFIKKTTIMENIKIENF